MLLTFTSNYNVQKCKWNFSTVNLIVPSFQLGYNSETIILTAKLQDCLHLKIKVITVSIKLNLYFDCIVKSDILYSYKSIY